MIRCRRPRTCFDPLHAVDEHHFDPIRIWMEKLRSGSPRRARISSAPASSWRPSYAMEERKAVRAGCSRPARRDQRAAEGIKSISRPTFHLGDCQYLYERLGHLAALPNRSQYRGYILEMMPNESAGIAILNLRSLAGDGAWFQQPELVLHSYSCRVCSHNKFWLSKCWNRFHV